MFCNFLWLKNDTGEIMFTYLWWVLLPNFSFSKFSFIFSCPKKVDYSTKVVFIYLWEKTWNHLKFKSRVFFGQNLIANSLSHGLEWKKNKSGRLQSHLCCHSNYSWITVFRRTFKALIFSIKKRSSYITLKQSFENYKIMNIYLTIII